MGLVRRELLGMPIQLPRISAHILLPFELSIGHRIEGTRKRKTDFVHTKLIALSCGEITCRLVKDVGTSGTNIDLRQIPCFFLPLLVRGPESDENGNCILPHKGEFASREFAKDYIYPGRVRAPFCSPLTNDNDESIAGELLATKSEEDLNLT